jgi:hypothetical protein
MSNVHVLLRTGSNRYRVAVHIAVPAGNNAAGLPWSTVLLTSGLGGTTVLATGNGTGTDGGIATAEKTSITNGTLYEYVTEWDTEGLTGAALSTLVTAHYNAAVTEQQGLLQALLNRFGTTV